MQPTRTRDKNKQFQPRWRHFHPQATLFMKNPFTDDIVFQVADEHDQPYQYRLPAGADCELPGGAIATLGLKEIVDRLIGESKEDAIRIWEPSVREKYEAKVIIRVKEAPQRGDPASPQGIVNLGATSDDTEVQDEPQKRPDELAFPGAKKNNKAVPADPPKGGGDTALARTAAASLGSKDQVIEED